MKLILVILLLTVLVSRGEAGFVCITTTTYKLCNVNLLGICITFGSEISCPVNTVCDPQNTNYCTAITTTTTTPKTTTTPATTPTASSTTTTSTTATTKTTTLASTSSTSTVITPTTTTHTTTTTTTGSTPSTTSSTINTTYSTTPTPITITNITTVTAPSITTVSIPTTTSLRSTSSPGGCSIPGEIVEDPNDCTSYFICTSNACGALEKVSVPCNDDYKFDPIRKICTKDPVDCQNTPVPPTCTCETTLPHPTDTLRYYECVKEFTPVLVKEHIVCSFGLVYDDAAKLCKVGNDCDDVPSTCGAPWGQISEDSDCLREEELPDKPLYFTSKCVKPGKFADALDCDRYYMCVKQPCGKITKTSQRCPSSNKFDAKTKSCKPSVKCLCTNRATPFICPTVGIFPDLECRYQYYYCVNESIFIPKPKTCPPGSKFDHKLALCIYNPSILVSISSESCSESKSDSSDMSALPCNDIEGHFAVDGECNSYFVCTNGVLVKQYCRRGLFFDIKHKHCKKRHLVRRMDSCEEVIINDIDLNIINLA